MFRRRKMLGLAVTSRSITAVEVIAANSGGRASRAAEFVLPDGVGLQEPAPLGRALKQFLRREGFSASRCVIGMAANWLTAREKTLPPGGGGSIRQILSLMIEREYASDRKELVFDYTLAEAAGEPSALLVAAPKRLLAQLAAMAEAAGLTVAGITASTMVLAGSADGPADHDQLVLHLFGGGAELAIRARGGLRMMRRLPLTAPAGGGADPPSSDGWLRELTDEMRRVVALLPGGKPGEEEAGRELLIWDETRLETGVGRLLSEQLALPVKVCQRPAGLEPEGAAPPASGGQFSAAAAMALGALRGRAPIVDLFHSRLSPQKTLGIGRRVAWAAAVTAALIVAGTVFALDWRSDRLDAASLETKLKAMRGELAEARATIAKVSFARPWYDRRPSYLACVRELTLAFPQEGLIWCTSLAIQEDMQVAVSGKAVSESAVLDVLDRLNANPKLSHVKPVYIRQTGRQGREVAFALSFTFIQSDGT